MEPIRRIDRTPGRPPVGPVRRLPPVRRDDEREEREHEPGHGRRHEPRDDAGPDAGGHLDVLA
jgi:hypothetical protein